MVQLNNEQDSAPKPLILLVDDEEAILTTLRSVLEDEGYRVVSLSDPRQVVQQVGELVPDLVLMDVCMPGLNGIDLLHMLKKEYPKQAVIMLSGYGNIPIALDAMRAGGSDFVEKPFSINELIEKIERCLGINNCATESTAVELIVQEASKFGLVGQSPLFLELLQQVAIAGKLTLPVMIYGPIGVGKRTFVQFIHHLRTMNGVVRDEEVHIIDCCALPSLEEFTAMLSCATTVFLYHVDRLPYEYQHVLVRECAHKRMLLYATATQSLYRAVTAGSILAALYDLVHCMPLEIPALSQRPYDIPLLVGYYLNKKNLENNRLVQIDQAAVRALRNHEWKKNIAELELVLQQCSAHAELYGGVITIEMVQRYLSRVDSTLIEEQLYHEYTSFDEAVACFQKKFLLYHLKKNRYDLELVSHKTKLNIVQLQNKLAALNIVFKK